MGALFDEPFMRVVLALLFAVVVLWMLFEVYEWAKKREDSRGDEGERRGAGGGAGTRRPRDRSETNDGDRDPGTTRSQRPDRPRDGGGRAPSGGAGSPSFGGATGEIGSTFKKEGGGTGASSRHGVHLAWGRSDRKDGPVPGRSRDGPEVESPRRGPAAGTTGDAAALPPRPVAGPDHARLVLEAWRDAWASDVVSVRSLVVRMGQVPGVRGVNVLPESSVLVVRFDGAFLAVPSQQDYELCEKLFEADRPPGRFATVIDLERAAVVSGTNGEVVQRGMLRIECG
jgi:hypothetical protein